MILPQVVCIVWAGKQTSSEYNVHLQQIQSAIKYSTKDVDESSSFETFVGCPQLGSGSTLPEGDTCRFQFFVDICIQMEYDDTG